MGFIAIVGVEICGIYGREQGDYIDHEEEARNTIKIELHLQVSSFNLTIFLIISLEFR